MSRAEHSPTTVEEAMDILVRWAVLILVIGCAITILYGDWAIWIPILLALAVMTRVLRCVGR